MTKYTRHKNSDVEEIETYSFQVNVISNGDDYPMVGYKDKNSKNLIWNYDGEN